MRRAATAALSVGTWCSGITPTQHAGGPGFNPQCVHLIAGLRPSPHTPFKLDSGPFRAVGLALLQVRCPGQKPGGRGGRAAAAVMHVVATRYRAFARLQGPGSEDPRLCQGSQL